MKKQAMNPFLPLDEYIPDGEPHVFGERIYLFGSHDTEGGTRYCSEENYVCYSAPLDDLAEWRYEGVIFEAVQNPYYEEGKHNDLYAPDVWYRGMTDDSICIMGSREKQRHQVTI